MKKKLNLIRKKSKKESPDKRITNDNLSEHREKVISSARKYKYPLRQSKHRLVIVSLTIFFLAVVAFFTYSVLALYKFKSETGFMYQVTKIIPFPLARIGSDFVSYESYLFEINWYKHYYKTQQNVDFESESGKAQLNDYRKRASQKVINDGYVKKLAEEKNITVSTEEIDQEVQVYKSQNRLGANDEQLKTVLSDYYGWSIDDFRSTLRQKLLTQKVVAALDTETRQKAEDALSQLNSGKDFTELAKEVSEDPSTSKNGGEMGILIDKNNVDLSPNTIDVLFELEPGQTSGIINVGYGLEIVKKLEEKDGKVKAAHIIFNFKNINEYLNEIKDRVETRTYINF